MVSQALGESELKTNRLSLEVGEGLLARESNAVRDTLNRLRALGVQLALDDFGKTGGALNMLQSYRFDMIKIDRALIKDHADANRKRGHRERHLRTRPVTRHPERR